MKNAWMQRIFSLMLCVCMLLALVGAHGISATATNDIAPQISVGNGFMVALASDGTAYAWGSNLFGMLGNGTQTDSSVPVQVIMPAGVRFASVSAGWNHVVALSTDGRIYTWGSNAYGQLGLEAEGIVTTPKAIPFSPSAKIVSVAAGNSFSLALTADGDVFAWGSNTTGQLGISHASLSATNVPRRIEALGDVTVTSIHAGNATAAAISAEGKVWLWGENMESQCGLSPEAEILPTQKSTSVSYFAVDVALGDHHSSFVELNGSIKGFGTNLYGQFGNGASPSDTPSVKMNGAILPEGVIASGLAAGAGHVVFVDSKGEIYSYGDNRKGQLGYTSESNTVTSPQKVSVSMEGAKAISLDACGNTTAMVDSNGLIWTWGENSMGQLGIGSYVDSAAPVGVLDEGGERLSLGRSSHTTVYQSSVTVNATVPSPTYSIEIPSGISVGELKQCDAKADGSHIVSKDLKVSVTDVNHLFGEKLILVTVNTESGKFELADGAYRLPYAVYGTLGNTPLTPGDEFAVFTKSESATGRIAFDQSLITREGSYSGRLIFEVKIESITQQ